MTFRKRLVYESLEPRTMLSGAPPAVFTFDGLAQFHAWGHRYTLLHPEYISDPTQPTAGWNVPPIGDPYNFTGEVSSSGSVGPSWLNGTWNASDPGQLVHWSDNGATLSTSIGVYVRDDLNGPVPYKVTVTDTVSISAEVAEGGWRGPAISLVGNASQSGSASKVFEGEAISTVTFAQYPGVTYRRVGAFQQSAWAIGPYYGPGYEIPPVIYADTEATSFIEVVIDRGEAPQVTIEAPADAVVGESVRLDVFAWDPDNGPRADGNGITYYKWEIRHPSGMKSTYEGTSLESLDAVFAETGESHVSLTVYDDEGMFGEAEKIISLASGVDLDVTSVLWKLAVPSWGRPETSLLPINKDLAIDVSVSNPGANDSKAFYVSCYLSYDLVPDAGDILLGSSLMEGIAGGSTGTTTLNITGGVDSTRIGTHNEFYSKWYGTLYVIAVADSTNAIEESNESNNNGFDVGTLADAAPDHVRWAAEFATKAEAVRALKKLGFREIDGIPAKFGDFGWYRNVRTIPSLVSPWDGVSRPGEAYREHGHVYQDKITKRWYITMQGPEPDPRYALSGTFLPWRRWSISYVALWHDEPFSR